MKQNAFATCEEMRASVVISVPCCVQDFGHGRDRDTVVCPKPRRIGSFNPHAMAEPYRPLRWHVSHQQEVFDAKAGNELLDLILAKDKQDSGNPKQSTADMIAFVQCLPEQMIQDEGDCLQSQVKDALLNALLLTAKRFSSGPPQLLTQICLVLSTLLIHTVEHGRPVEKLFYSMWNLQSQEDGDTAVLEMLTVLPKVIEDHIINFCKSLIKCYEYEQQLLLHTPVVIEFLLHQIEEIFGGGIQLPY